jgi:hypothetical protein
LRRTPSNILKAYERREEVTRQIIEDLRTAGIFFQTTEGYFYFLRTEAPKLFAIENDSVSLVALIEDRYGINSAENREFDHVISGLRTEAHLNGEEVEVHRLAHYDPEAGKLYVSRFNGWVYRLDGKQIREVPNGTDGVFFWDSPAWKPY